MGGRIVNYLDGLNQLFENIFKSCCLVGSVEIQKWRLRSLTQRCQMLHYLYDGTRCFLMSKGGDWRVRETNRRKEKQADTDKHRNRKTEKETEKEIERQTDRQRDGERDRQMREKERR